MDLLESLKAQLKADTEEFETVKLRRTKRERKRYSFLFQMINTNVAKINLLKQEENQKFH